jgi:hypothetical protein
MPAARGSPWSLGYRPQHIGAQPRFHPCRASPSSGNPHDFQANAPASSRMLGRSSSVVSFVETAMRGTLPSANSRWAVMPNAVLCSNMSGDDALDALIELRGGRRAQALRDGERGAK